MLAIVAALAAAVPGFFRSHVSLQLEIVALRHQLAVYQRRSKRPPLKAEDRAFWVVLSRLWSGWRSAVVFVQPATVVRWQRRRFRDHWRRVTESPKPGRPPVPEEVRRLIRQMSSANPLWGSPRIVGELRKIGIEVAKSTVETYMVRKKGPASPTWKSFLRNHRDLVSVDFFVVPTVRFGLLWVFLVVATERRRVLHFNVTDDPTSAWVARQVVEAFPYDPQPVAERLRGTDDRNDPARVSRSRARVECPPPQARPAGLPGLLPPVAHSSLAGLGCARRPPGQRYRKSR